MSEVDETIARASQLIDRTRERRIDARGRKMRAADLRGRITRIAVADVAILVAAMVLGWFIPLGMGGALLVMAALSQGRPEKIKDIIASDLPETPYNRTNYYLAEAMIAATQGKRYDAARNWKSFSQLMRAKDSVPDEMLRSIVLHPEMRREVVAILQKGGAFGA